MKSLYYNRDGSPTELMEWAKNFEGDRKVCFTKFWWGGRLSTVFLGLDHSFGDGPPLIFETMLFTRKGHELGQWRYSAEKQAIEHHSQLVRAIKKQWGKCFLQLLENIGLLEYVK